MKKKNLRQILIPAFIITACIPIAIFTVISQARLHKDSHQDQATQRFQLAYHYPVARQYLCTLHFDCHEHFVLRQYQCQAAGNGGRVGLQTYEGQHHQLDTRGAYQG